MIALSCRLADDGGGRGNLLHHVKWEGELPGRGGYLGNMSGGDLTMGMPGSLVEYIHSIHAPVRLISRVRY